LQIFEHSVYKVIINVVPAYACILGQYLWLNLIFKFKLKMKNAVRADVGAWIINILTLNKVLKYIGQTF